MTRAEATFFLANMDRRYMEEGMSKALDMAINTLNAIDDIKAEIADIYVGYRHGYEIRNDALEIIDKHIGKENNGKA